MAYPAAAVANYLLDLAKEDGDTTLNPMKIQKLVYFSHGWFLAFNDAYEPLIEERFEAWKYGPVVPSLYRCLKGWGSRTVAEPVKITRVLPSSRSTGGVRISQTAPTLDDEPDSEDRRERTKQIIRAVWDNYHHYTAIQLSNATHAPGSPWATVWERDSSGNAVIADDLIKADFVRRQQSSAATQGVAGR